MQHMMDRSIDEDIVCNVVSHKLEAFVPEEMSDIRGIARDEVVDANDMMTFGKQPVCNVGAKEPCPAGDDGGDWLFT